MTAFSLVDRRDHNGLAGVICNANADGALFSKARRELPSIGSMWGWGCVGVYCS